jgi:hypothetical protein
MIARQPPTQIADLARLEIGSTSVVTCTQIGKFCGGGQAGILIVVRADMRRVQLSMGV